MTDEYDGARTDKDILQDIERELLVDEVVSTDNVQVQVENGKVILTGEVGSLEVKQKVGDIAENVNGVVLVNNDLRIERI
ncbi:MAG: BON domain-containing protein [Parcubacteria group bacterium]|nr:BON domain-containing protein [Parcubacteria group bacterium]